MDTTGVTSGINIPLPFSECGAAHAILLSSIVPYSQISFSVQVNIAEKYDSHLDTVSVCESNPDIDENNIKA